MLEECLRGHGIRRWIVARQTHKSGAIHYHAGIEVEKKFDIKDIKKTFRFRVGMNPNYIQYTPSVSKETKPDFEGWAYYCMKDKDYISEWEKFWHPNDFCKRRRDLEAFEIYNYEKTLQSPFPFMLPEGTIVNEPRPQDKKVNFWIYGDPNFGKTEWVEMTF